MAKFTYDVFLSFRGEDTRHNFIGYLRKELQRKGINAFFDDQNLRIGEGISPALSKAIEESNISVIVFSKNYASSTWCLNELVKILECTKRNNKQLAYPIFFHVDPSDVRRQRNSYGEAMLAHEKRFGEDSENIKAWRSALSEAANLKGHHIHTGSEIDHMEKIVKDVYANIAPKPLHDGQDPIGLEHRIEEVASLLDLKPNDNTVCTLGIYGLGGIGKTELAKALYNKIVHQFDAASFLANVREKSNKSNGLEDLQKTLLSEMLEELETELGSTSKGIYEIKHKLGKKKVLLVLDDVDDREQLNNLAGGCDWFGSGSRIIVTTRDKDLLIGHQVQKIYEMTKLNDQHSLELFCRNAFEKSHPETGYEYVTCRAVCYAKGLPLALKVIGSDFATQNSLEVWEDALKEYERSPPKGIQDVLKISYNRLGHNAKTVFLDIACFFKRERIEYVKKILEEFGAPSNIKELVNKSLLTVEEGGCLNMHDLIQDMGREIVRQEARNPGKRSRLWFYEDVLEVLAEDSGSDEIEGIMLDPPQREVVDWSGTAFEKMKWLRILVVRKTSFSSEPKYLPNHLRLLDWEEYPSKSFPPKFHPKKIIVLNLPRSQLTMEKPFEKLSCLTELNFSNNQSITAIPDVSDLQNLREVTLDYCQNLITVHESVGFLKYLVHLCAYDCARLRNFPQRMFLPSLGFLGLRSCKKLEHFPEIVNNMNKPLMEFDIAGTSIEELPDSIGNLTGLHSIYMSDSGKLKDLPNSLFMVANNIYFDAGGLFSQLRDSFIRLRESRSAANGHPALKKLCIEFGGLSDADLHIILTCFPKLDELRAQGNNFVSLPAYIKDSLHLTSLDVSHCVNLREIPECTNLRVLDVSGCVRLEHISEFPSTIEQVDARDCFSLSRETSAMLWHQVKEERWGFNIVMPHETEIPEWFDYSCEGGNPHFWAHGKIPVVAVALVFNDVLPPQDYPLIGLNLVINGQHVPREDWFHSFVVALDHVLVCDLRVLFSEEKWLGLDALLVHEWNLVQVEYDAEFDKTTSLSCWGVFGYKQGTNMEDIQFMCPDPKYLDSDIASTSYSLDW